MYYNCVLWDGGVLRSFYLNYVSELSGMSIHIAQFAIQVFISNNKEHKNGYRFGVDAIVCLHNRFIKNVCNSVIIYLK